MPKRPRRRYGWWLFGLLVLGALVLLGLAIAREMHTSRLQAREFSQFAATLSYSMHKGPSDAVIYPGEGPFDKRLGYSALGEFLPRLFKRDYVIVEQARFSPALMNYVQHGFFVPYAEKIQAGLSITDCKGDALYQFHYPQHLYPDFASIPPVIVHSLLFIENRDLLDPADPRSNPAVDWPRFAMAAYSQVAKHLALPGQSAGGSTLATQLEKYRHSPDGLTVSGSEKLRQMISASVRAYQDGPQTLGDASASCATTSTACRCRRCPATAKCTAWPRACGCGTAPTLPRSTRPWPVPTATRPAWPHEAWRCARCCR